MCSWLFHMKVPTRASPSMPSERRPCASRAALALTSANVALRLPRSPTVMIELSP